VPEVVRESARRGEPRPEGGEDRLVVLADPAIGFAPPLAAAALATVRTVPGLRAVALVDAAASAPPRLAGAALRVARAVASRAFPPPGGRCPRWRRTSLRSLARRHRVPLIVPPGRDVDDAGLRHRLAALGANLALSVGCRQVFGPALLASFDVAVNFHDGLLPDYRGLAATSWSVYRGEAHSGFAFHHMVAELDAGPVLLAGALPSGEGADPLDLLRRKADLAARRIGEVLAAMRRRDPGTPQPPGGVYFGRADRLRICEVGDPGALDWTELRRRLAAFGAVLLDLGGRRWEVTALETVDGAAGPAGGNELVFRTRDGVLARPVRFRHLPRGLYVIAERLRPVLGGAW